MRAASGRRTAADDELRDLHRGEGALEGLGEGQVQRRHGVVAAPVSWAHPEWTHVYMSVWMNELKTAKQRCISATSPLSTHIQIGMPW